MEEIEYIERKTLIEAAKHNTPISRCEADFVDIKKLIEDIPAADVRPERHGEWLYVAVDIYGVCREYAKQCSICGSVFPVSFWENNTFNFCPNCGARMDGDENDP